MVTMRCRRVALPHHERAARVTLASSVAQRTQHAMLWDHDQFKASGHYTNAVSLDVIRAIGLDGHTE